MGKKIKGVERMTEKSFWGCKYLRYERDNEYVKQLGCQKTNNLCLKKVCDDFELKGDVND